MGKATCEATADNSWQKKNGDWAFVDSPTNIVPFGDVNPATGDDPILPSKFWAEKPDGVASPLGSARERFFNDIKPGMLDAFQSCSQLLACWSLCSERADELLLMV